ncbi:hypothetical protein [Stutzerimonas nitrititolerans]|uniref:hypothetical protein n=1 Tax=Stutzerimonas nitrititolerans TaxID=2482751 RepID=UPI0028B14B35|nr:hypothetical protein [Stutzerimonas nitrititolerans]
MQHTDKARAEFEAWWDRQPFHEQFEDMKQQMANVWVASRADLANMDGLKSVHHQFGMVCLHFRTTEQTQQFVRTCRSAIESAGVKVKE